MNFTINTSGKQGLTLLKTIREKYPDLLVILMTGWATVQLAVEGMKIGAKDFIAKPWENKHLLASIKSILDLYSTDLSDKIDSNSEIGEMPKMIGSDPAFLQVLNMAQQVAATEASVLIMGESGTGKELLAETIHQLSHRKDKPFVKVNLGGISSSLFESEMFGHKKGAFTDAYDDREGRFSVADGGTIFLDEIGELPLQNQVKLLRVLQEKTFEVLGSSKSQRSDFRVVSATNKNLASLVASGAFREDLFYRVNLITIELPSLQNRSSDIPQMAQHFAQQVCHVYQKKAPYISSETLNWLSKQSYPGNIRELKNQVERTLLLNFNEKEISITHFKKTKLMGSNPETRIKIPEVGSISLAELEISMIKKALNFHNHNISKTARSLGISRSALYRRLDKHNIPYEPSI